MLGVPGWGVLNLQTMLTLLAIAALQPGPWIKQFELYPPVSSSAALRQADVDAGRAKSLAKVYRGPGDNQASVDNGLIRVTISLEEPQAILAFGPRGQESASLRHLASPQIAINGRTFDLGDPESGLRIFNVQGVLYFKPFEYQSIGKGNVTWPPRGMGLKISYAHPEIQGFYIERRLELLDGEPTLHQSIVLRNGSPMPYSLQSTGANKEWPPAWLAGRELNLVVRPGRVLELPSQWITLTSAGDPIPMRNSGWATIAPWRRFIPLADPSAPPAQRTGNEVILFEPENPVSWGAVAAEDSARIADFVATAQESELIPGVQADLDHIPATDADRTAGPGSPVCWLSLAGKHWRQNALLNWKRSGIKFVSLQGDLPLACDKTGHDHQNPVAAEFENREAMRQFVIAGLGIGVVIRHPQMAAYGPAP